MFFLVAVGLLTAILTAFAMSGFGWFLILLSIPVGASIGAALAGSILAWQYRRELAAACDPKHVRSSVASGLRSLFSGAIREPLPKRIEELAGRLVTPSERYPSGL